MRTQCEIEVFAENPHESERVIEFSADESSYNSADDDDDVGASSAERAGAAFTYASMSGGKCS